MRLKREIPKIYGHELSLMIEGIGSKNSKEYCRCNDCKELRTRRNKIYNKPHHRLRRWISLKF